MKSILISLLVSFSFGAVVYEAITAVGDIYGIGFVGLFGVGVDLIDVVFENELR